MPHLFTIDDEMELYALWVALLEVQFHPDLETPELQGSPFVANLAKRVTEALISNEERKYNFGVAESYRDAIKNGEKYLNVIPVVRKNLQSIDENIWTKWTKEQKEEALKHLLSPYEISEKLFEDLIENKGKI